MLADEMRRRGLHTWRGLAAGLACVACVAWEMSCEGTSGPRRDCSAVVWARPERAGAALEVIGAFNQWYVPGIPLAPSAEDPAWQFVRLELPPGEYGYLILEDGEHRVDPYNPLTTFWREQEDLEVSLLRVADCSRPAISIEASEATAAGAMTVVGRFAAASDGAPLVRAEARTLAGEAVATEIDPADGAIRITRAGLGRGKHTLELVGTDAEGRQATARVSGWVQPAAATWGEGLLYQVMIDRFRGDGGASLEPPPDPGARSGGTLDGVLAELEAGTFERLGVTALWLSPVYTNPLEAREGRGDGHMYEGYHGYWPLEPRTVEPRIGGEAALRAVIAAAHARGIRVIFDLVPNHVYEASERYTGSPSDQWNMSDPPCVCGLDGCDWGRHIQTCWFTDYLPDLRMQHPDSLRWAYEDAIWWSREFDADGLRIDAVPMMPRAATRRIAAELRERVAPRGLQFMVGEVYTGPGAWGVEAIRYYLGPDGLDSVFDFPLMWAIRDAVAHESAGFSAVEGMLRDVTEKTAGSGAVLARMIGNHDTTRFVSEAAGGVAADPWASPAEQPGGDEPYARQGLALGLVLTMPGLPVIYYGDEVGLAGGQDPDCRRVMPAWDALSPALARLLAQTRRLGRLRRCSAALRTGGHEAVVVQDDVYAFVRADEGGAGAVVVVSRDAVPRTVALPGLALGAGSYVDALTGEGFELAAGGAEVEVPPRSLRVLLPAGDPCLADP